MTYQPVNSLSEQLNQSSTRQQTSNVKLIWTTPYGDNEIAYMARVSAKDQHDTPDRLIKYLIENNHWSPFEMVNMCVEIRTTRSISAQILRHRSFSFQEFSQRYAEVIEDPIVPDLRRQDTKNRQNSIDDLDPLSIEQWELLIKRHNEDTMGLYKALLNAGVAKECARQVLPMSIPTKIYMNGTLRSWLHYCDLRSSNGTQKEHKLIAEGCKDLLKLNFPHTYKAYYG